MLTARLQLLLTERENTSSVLVRIPVFMSGILEQKMLEVLAKTNLSLTSISLLVMSQLLFLGLEWDHSQTCWPVLVNMILL